MGALFLFIFLSVLNVLIGTIKILITINGSKLAAAGINALAYSLNILIIDQTADPSLDIYSKVLIVALTNFIGVYIVKLIEEKRSKDRLWKIEGTVPADLTLQVEQALTENKIPHKRVEGIDDGFGQCTVFSIYSKTKAQSSKVKNILKEYRVKYFIVESQIL